MYFLVKNFAPAVNEFCYDDTFLFSQVKIVLPLYILKF